MKDLFAYRDWLAERIDGTAAQIALIPESKCSTQKAIVLDEMLEQFNGSYVLVCHFIASRETVPRVPQSTAAP